MRRYVPLIVFMFIVLVLFYTYDAPPSCLSLEAVVEGNNCYVLISASDDRGLSSVHIFVNAFLYSVCPLEGMYDECNVLVRLNSDALRIDAEVVDNAGKTDRCPARLIFGLGIKKLQNRRFTQ